MSKEKLHFDIRNKLLAPLFSHGASQNNEKIFSAFHSSYRNFRKLEKAVEIKHSPVGSYSQSISRSPKLPLMLPELERYFLFLLETPASGKIKQSVPHFQDD